MMSLLQVLQHAAAGGIGIGHFNTSESVTLRGVVEAALERHVPVVIGASEDERRFIGVHQIVALVRSLREQHGLPIFLKADHSHSLPDAMEAARAGFDRVVCDYSALPFDQNVQKTRAAVEALKSLRPPTAVGRIWRPGSIAEIRRQRRSCIL